MRNIGERIFSAVHIRNQYFIHTISLFHLTLIPQALEKLYMSFCSLDGPNTGKIAHYSPAIRISISSELKLSPFSILPHPSLLIHHHSSLTIDHSCFQKAMYVHFCQLDLCY